MANSNPDNNATTPSLNEVTATQPNYTSHHDHSFTLQAIMEMQKTLGGLCEKIDSLNTRINNFEKRLESVESTVSSMSHKQYAAGIILLMAIAIGGFIIDKAWDLVVEQIKPKIEETVKK